jgi:hypothetical protein
LLKEKPNLMANILCELKGTVSARIRNESSDEKIQLYTKSGRSVDGKPVFLGNFSDQIQELSLPSTMPVNAKAVRIVYNIRFRFPYHHCFRQQQASQGKTLKPTPIPSTKKWMKKLSKIQIEFC